MKFTKIEISLCEQIAEKHRRNLKIGMYVWRKFCKSVQLIYRLDKEDKEIYTVILKGKKLNHLYWNNLKGGWLTPLWALSDCLEFLKGRNYDCILYSNRSQLRWYLKFNIYPLVSSMEILNGGKTPLEVCLKAVLAVLEEEKA